MGNNWETIYIQQSEKLELQTKMTAIEIIK